MKYLFRAPAKREDLGRQQGCQSGTEEETVRLVLDASVLALDMNGDDDDEGSAE